MNISGLVGIFRGSLTVTLVGGLTGSPSGTVVCMVDESTHWTVEDDAVDDCSDGSARVEEVYY